MDEVKVNIPAENNTVILDGKTVTLTELNEAKAKNPKRIIFDEAKNEYRTLQVLRG